MVSFTPDINLGSIVAAGGTIISVFLFIHRYDKEHAIKNNDFLNKINSIESTVYRVEHKVDDNTVKTERIASQIGEHIAEDRIIHSLVDKRLDKLDG